MFSAASVCLFVDVFVCQQDNVRTSKHRMMKLRGRCIIQKSRPSSNLQPPKMWRFADSRCMMKNVNKAMRAGERSHQTQRPYSTCLQLRQWENQHRLSSFYVYLCNDCLSVCLSVCPSISLCLWFLSVTGLLHGKYHNHCFYVSVCIACDDNAAQFSMNFDELLLCIHIGIGTIELELSWAL